MSNKSTTKSALRYWIYLVIALSVFFAGLGASAIVFVFSSREWLNTAIHAAIITFNSLSITLIIPRLLSLALCGQDVQRLKKF